MRDFSYIIMLIDCDDSLSLVSNMNMGYRTSAKMNCNVVYFYFSFMRRFVLPNTVVVAAHVSPI